MPTPKHTPTPWYIDPDATGEEGDGWVQADQPGVGRVDIFLRPWWNHADATRIVQCVNACEGMDDPAAEIARLRSELAEATAALLNERGEGEPPEDGWKPAGRDRWEHPRAKVWWHGGWRWGLYPTKGDYLRATALGGIAEGTAPTARAAMRAATEALTPKDR